MIFAPRAFISSMIQVLSNAVSTARQGMSEENVPRGGAHRAALQAFDQRRHPNRVVAIGRHQNEPNQGAKRIHQSQDLGGPTAFRFAYGLALSPPFAPIHSPVCLNQWRSNGSSVNFDDGGVHGPAGHHAVMSREGLIAYSISGSSLKASNIRLKTSA